MLNTELLIQIKKKFKILEPYEGASEQAAFHIIIGKGIINAYHGQITEYNEINKNRCNHKKQDLVLSQFKQKAPAPFP